MNDRPSSPSADPQARAPSAWRALFAGIGWIALTIVVGTALGVALELSNFTAGWAAVVLTMVVGSLVLVPVVLAGGLGAYFDAPIRRVWAIPLAVLAGVAGSELLQLLQQVVFGAPDMPDSIRWLIGLLEWPWLAVVFVVLLAPVCEELFFRGWLWRRLAVRWSVTATGIATGLLFALIHFDDALLVLPAAVVLTLVRIHCGGGLIPSLVVHVLNNAAAVAQIYVTGNWPGLD